MLTPRERVLCAINHEEPDRVPIFFGANSSTSILVPAHERLMAYMGINGETRLLSRLNQYAEPDEEIRRRFGADARPIGMRAGPNALRRDVSDSVTIDDWGVTWEHVPGSPYYQITGRPLQHATVYDLETYPWPDVGHPSRFAGLRDEARRMHEETPYAVVGLGYSEIFDQMQHMRGSEFWLMDLAADPDFAHAALRKITDLMLAQTIPYIEAIGPYIDLFSWSDDLGSQRAPLISPKMYRRMIKPYHAEIIAAVKARCKAKIFFHSCGNVYPLIGDLIDIGVDVLNPIQVAAGEMGDTARLKREFGSRLTFCGGVDTQRVLPYGTPDEVRAEVRRRICDLAPGGGYIFAAVHSIQPDVPPENLCAMFDEALSCGKYPLAL